MSKRILVVEDQEDNRQIIRDLLTFTDYEITEAESGEQALEAVAKQRPDLILVDIQLPGMDGYEVTRRIKADSALRSIPIIAVTSYALSGRNRKRGRPGVRSQGYAGVDHGGRRKDGLSRSSSSRPSCTEGARLRCNAGAGLVEEQRIDVGPQLRPRGPTSPAR